MTSPTTHYHERITHFSAERDRRQQQSDINGNISLGLVALTIMLLGFWLWQAQPWLLLGAGVCAFGFVVSFLRHGEVNRQLRMAREHIAINTEGLQRLARDWSHLPLHDPALADPSHPYAADLDLCGRGSLEQLLHTPSMPVGRATLRSWLLAPAGSDTIQRRQAAVAELRNAVDLREALALDGRLSHGIQSDYTLFLQWAEAEPWLLRRPLLIWAGRMLGALGAVLAVARLAGQPVDALLAVVLVVNVIVFGVVARRVEQEIEQATAKQEMYAAYAKLFARLTGASFAAPELTRLQTALLAQNTRADIHMQRLARIMPLAEVRKWMFFFPIQITTLWNIHVLWLLERWRQQAGSHARDWFVALGEAEALAALATLAFDNPTWVFPELCDTPEINATQLGHPLLAPEVCVENDVVVGPPGSMLLITGSNMSGKSTLLRALGINIVLAQAGGVVCAQMMRLPPVALATSMRVRDSLEHGVSYFMAELRRLKFVVEQAEHGEADRIFVFLLDEILHGTNSGERLIAARAVLRYLLDQGTMGAVSTHDLALADSAELATNSVFVHFTEQFARTDDGPSMRFDYRLRPGLAQSTNALKLMELVGLPVEGGDGAMGDREDKKTRRKEGETEEATR